jgi:hypothetical protein
MSEKPVPIDRIILSFPSLLSLADTKPSIEGGARSWVQLARTGSFVSNRYGKFSITRDDLCQMLHNFDNVTPKAPTELPVDYDHLSMDPKKPGDGIAAGWMKKLELRKEGEELWAEVEWTPTGAERIKNAEYRFVSPSFVKEYKDKNGEKIGTTLLAAGITNHPFLEQMSALTLYNFSVMGDLATAVEAADKVVNLASVGQRVSFVDDAERTPELTAEERTQTFLVKSTVGEGDDQFVRLTRLDGAEAGWFKASQLLPAPAPPQAHEGLLLDRTQEDTMPQTDIEKLAAQFSLTVTRKFQDTRNWVHAFHLAQVEDERATGGKGAEAYRVAGMGAQMADEDPVPAPLNLAVRPGESFDELAMRYATEKGVSLREAVHEVGRARPDLVAAR